MRTTLNIDDDVLAAAKELARARHTSTGRVVSQLLRSVLTGQVQPGEQEPGGVGGFRPFAARGEVVSNERVDALRDAEGI
jgi:predicted transcriptional regulator